MKIRLDEEDINHLYYLRSHPGTNGVSSDIERFTRMELIERCRPANFKQYTIAAKKAWRKLQRYQLNTNFGFPQLDRDSIGKAYDGTNQLSQDLNDYRSALSAMHQTGIRLTAKGLKLLSDIDKCTRDAKWSVAAKSAELIIEL